MNLELANAVHILKLSEIERYCSSIQGEELKDFDQYQSRDHRRTMEWVLMGKKEIAKEILKKLGVENV